MIILDSEVKECIDWMIKTFNTKILFEYRDKYYTRSGLTLQNLIKENKTFSYEIDNIYYPGINVGSFHKSDVVAIILYKIDGDNYVLSQQLSESDILEYKTYKRKDKLDIIGI